MLSAESTGSRFSNVTPVADGASRSNSGGASSAGRQAAAPIPSNISSEDRMNRTTRFARSPFGARLARCGGAALVIVAIAACGHPNANPAPTPTATSSKEVKTDAQMPTNMSIEEYLASRSAGVEIGHANGTVTVRLRGASHAYGSN